MQRDESVFVVGTTNLITQAANMARRFAERQHNFEMSKVQAQIASVHYTNGALLSTAKLRGTVTSVDVKAIEAAFLSFSDGSGEFPIEVMSRQKHVARIARHYEQARTTNRRESMPSPLASFTLVRYNDLVYITPGDATALGGTTVVLSMDVVQWLPPYVGDTDSDFFLNYCADYMLLGTVHMLNFMIKEDVRVPVSEKLMASSWQSLLCWDANIVMNAAEDVELD
jgi:hypothetical protein